MNKTSIEWTDYTWNPVTGCTKTSAGCRSCYAETLFKRFGKKHWGHEFTDVTTHPERLEEPVEMREKLVGKRVFVCDISDLFHEKVPFEFILQVYFTIIRCPFTTFQVLTKRIDRALEFYQWCAKHLEETSGLRFLLPKDFEFNLPNLWIGTSVEDQEQADKRIPVLLEIPAVVHFVSCEPLIGPVDLSEWLNECGGSILDWVIVGGESGNINTRPMHPDWVRKIRDHCKSAGVPFFFKQWGEYMPIKDIAGDFDIARVRHVGKYTNSMVGMYAVGKGKSGNFLDGKQHLEFPKHKEGVPR